MANEIVFLSNARLSFPHLIEPQRSKTAKGEDYISYNCDLLLPAEDAGLQRLMKAIGKLAEEKWKEHAANVLNLINQERKNRCYGRGEEKVNKKTFQPYDGYAGQMYVTANNSKQPQVIDADGKTVDPTNTMMTQHHMRQLYGGCRVNVAVKPWAQNNEYGRAIRCELVAIQFAGDDTPFGEAETDASSMFGKIAAQPTAQTEQPAMPLPPFMGGL